MMNKRVNSVVKYVEEYAESVEDKYDEFWIDTSNDFDNTTLAEQPKNFNAPIIWERTTTGYRIADLLVNQTNTALELISNHFIREEPMALATPLSEDSHWLKMYRQLLTNIMKKGHSLCALHEGTGKLVGVSIGSPCLKTNKIDPIGDGGTLCFVINMKNHIYGSPEVGNKIDGVEYFKVVTLCVDPEYRQKGVGTALLRSCVEKTKSLNLSICIGAFSSDTSQRIAGRLGFEKLAEIPYATYTAGNHKRAPIANILLRNYSLACMALRIIPETETSSPPDDSPTVKSNSKKR